MARRIPKANYNLSAVLLDVSLTCQKAAQDLQLRDIKPPSELELLTESAVSMLLAIRQYNAAQVKRLSQNSFA